MYLDLLAAQYAVAAIAALTDGQLPPVIRSDCPDCGAALDEYAGEPTPGGDHLLTPIRGLGPVLLITCEGHWIIDPNAVGVSAPNWIPTDG